MSIANLNQFPNEVMQDSALQDQFNTAAAVQELSDAELESVAGGFFNWEINDKTLYSKGSKFSNFLLGDFSSSNPGAVKGEELNFGHRTLMGGRGNDWMYVL